MMGMVWKNWGKQRKCSQILTRKTAFTNPRVLKNNTRTMVGMVRRGGGKRDKCSQVLTRKKRHSPTRGY